ncbi:MAG: dihydrofolate reductase [Burkholderiaceae bacterium]|nr:dihydrofolate reductase [Rhodoferax sp.]MCW5627851.1 dihydrofolate reductase [Rhodoferax sp.]
MRINLIYARARNGVIGANNSLPWHLPQDLAHFKRLTAGAPVIMGRKTWDSLPPRFKPLPGRTNIVVTRQRDWNSDGALAADSLEWALALCTSLQPRPSEVWVIGGAQLFAAAMPLARRAVVTELARDFDGDVFAPTLEAPWTEASREEQVAPDGLHFAFVTYVREPQAPTQEVNPQ